MHLIGTVAFWRDTLHATPAILSVIESVYVLLLTSEPAQFNGENQSSAVDNAEFVNDCIAELVSGGCVSELETAPVVCSPLSVVENSKGKKRLVVNLRYLNMFLYKLKLKYEDLRVAMLLLKKITCFHLTRSLGTTTLTMLNRVSSRKKFSASACKVLNIHDVDYLSHTWQRWINL